MNIYILKDKLTNMPAGTHFNSATNASAVRDCIVNFKNHEETVNQFELYKVGEYDLTSGEIVNTDYIFVCNLSDYKEILSSALK